ncbi:MAG: alpha,alpha-trehalase [Bacteroidia bacterium]
MTTPASLVSLAVGLLLCCLAACTPAAAPRQAPTAVISPVEAYGPLFEAVQMGGLFPDSKTFADARPRMDPATIVAHYEARREAADFDLRAFVDAHFDIPTPRSSDFVSDTSHSVLAHIEALWPVLTRQPDTAGAGSLIPLPYPYIVPGGRFREVYYWDSYFTMQGLRHSKTHRQLIGSMCDNFAYLLDTLGFIPNGNRSYYLGRSQPPFFSQMVRLAVETDSSRSLGDFLIALQQEYDFWMDGAETLDAAHPAHRRVLRMPDGAILNRYWDDVAGPRPESYREDVLLARETGRDADSLYRHLRAAAESGWDFSSRWLRDGQTLGTIHTTDIVPVDLNALLCHLEQTLRDAWAQQGDTARARRYDDLARRRQQALDTWCWSEGERVYVDYDWMAGSPTPVRSLAMCYPLYLGLASDQQAAAVADYLSGHLLAPGGLLTTDRPTGQQWDAPNGWAPLQWIAVQGLARYEQRALALDIRSRWVSLNEQVYRRTGKLVEKYDVADLSLEAGGGEYPLQDGFGWTNGVLAGLLADMAWGDGTPILTTFPPSGAPSPKP